MSRFLTDVLEFSKVKGLIAPFVASSPGKVELEALEPADDPERNRRLLGETLEMQRLLDRSVSVPLLGITDLGSLLDRTTPAGTLMEGRELLELRGNLVATSKMRDFLVQYESALPLLAQRRERLVAHPELVDAIDAVVDSHGAIRDSASPALWRLRKQSRETRRELLERLERIMRRPEIRPLLQECLVTVRAGRYVLPVHAKERRKIKGILHDRSSSGTTLYIEPEETVVLGNRLRELEALESIEVHRILRALTGRLRRNYDDFRQAQAVLAHIDLTTAKARFAQQYRCCYPVLREGANLSIRGGRHPLLVAMLGERTVPSTIYWPPGVKGLVITGPNTGGKTVCVKLVGIVALLSHAGVPTPCDDVVMPCLSAVLADIGDEQSIEQNLSTFSSHIKRITSILDAADERSLVLLDELGAGTDPLEGAALAVAIAREACRRAGCVVMTTHLAELKVLAYEAAEIENAAMLFDERTLAPTFELAIGAAGQSNALAIAERLGLAAHVLNEARAALQRSQERPEAMLARLYHDTQEAARLRAAADAEREKAENLRREQALALQRAERQKEDALQRARVSSAHLMREIEQQANTMKRKLRGLREHAERIENKLRAMGVEEAVLAEVTAMENELATVTTELGTMRLKQQAPAQATETTYTIAPLDIQALRVGQRVEIHGHRQLAEVIAIDPARRKLRVVIGMMELVISPGQIVGVAEPASVPATESGAVRVYHPQHVPAPTLDLIGKTVDEMTPELEAYLEQAYLSECSQVTIVHGYGTGVLRRAVRALLAASPLVAGIADGDLSSGGRAVTVVTLKQR